MTHIEATIALAEWAAVQGIAGDDCYTWAANRYLDMVQANVAALIGRGDTWSEVSAAQRAVGLTHATIAALKQGEEKKNAQDCCN